MMGSIEPQANGGDLTTGANGRTRLAWEQVATGSPLLGSYGSSFGSYGGLLGSSGARIARQASLAMSISRDFMISDSITAAIINAKVTAALGTGLTLSAKPDAAAIGISEDEAQQLASDIEAEWNRWANNPRACDLMGQSTLHGLAAAGFTSWLISGEFLAVMEWQSCRDAWSRTKCWLMDPEQLDRTKSIQSLTGNSIAGVEYNRQGRIVGFWLRELNPGKPFEVAMPKLVPISTSWGRPKVIWLWDKKLPLQPRGLSPLTPALTSIAERNLLGEYTLTSALIQTGFAVTVETDQPAAVAAGGLNSVPTYMQPPGVGIGTQPYDINAARLEYYGSNKVQTEPGKVNFLAQGDKMKMNSVKGNGAYKDHNTALLRQAAKAVGSSVENITGDYSQTSFSASRLAEHLPFQITLRERNTILAPFYAAVYRCFLEECMMRDVIKLPRTARPFWDCPEAYCNSKFLGPGQVVADPKKYMEANILAIENGLLTMSDVLGQDGKDFDEVLKQRKREKAAIEAAGLKGWFPGPGNTSTQVRLETIDQEDNSK